jgi:hypothetical protein
MFEKQGLALIAAGTKIFLARDSDMNNLTYRLIGMHSIKV